MKHNSDRFQTGQHTTSTRLTNMNKNLVHSIMKKKTVVGSPPLPNACFSKIIGIDHPYVNPADL